MGWCVVVVASLMGACAHAHKTKLYTRSRMPCVVNPPAQFCLFSRANALCEWWCASVAFKYNARTSLALIQMCARHIAIANICFIAVYILRRAKYVCEGQQYNTLFVCLFNLIVFSQFDVGFHFFKIIVVYHL